VRIADAVNEINGFVDVQRDGSGWTRIAGAIDVDRGVSHADHLMQSGPLDRLRRSGPTRHGRLRTEIAGGIGQSAAGQLEAGIAAQMIQVVGVLVSAGDREHADP
jgi:hypothetical protein